jgi:hypothetical protein
MLHDGVPELGGESCRYVSGMTRRTDRPSLREWWLADYGDVIDVGLGLEEAATHGEQSAPLSPVQVESLRTYAIDQGVRRGP